MEEPKELTDLKELKKRHRALLPQHRVFTLKSKNGTITNSELEQYNLIDGLYNKNNSEIFETQRLFILNNHGEEKLTKWDELQRLKSTQYTTASETGKRVHELSLALADITAIFESLDEI